MKILVLCSDNPSPPINGTRIRNFHLWPEVRKLGHEVKVLALTRNKDDLKLSNSEIEFFLFTKKNFLLRIWMRLFHSYHEWPVSDSLESRVDELIREWKPEIVHADELRMGYYLPDKTPTDTHCLFSVCAHNVESKLIKKTLAAPFSFGVSFFNSIYHFNLVKFEKKVCAKTQVRFTYSEIDKKIYEALYPQYKWNVSSNGVNVIELKPEEMKLPSSQNLLFLGSLGYLPNMEGLFWFLENIHPHLPVGAKLTVAGSNPASVVRERLAQMKIPLIDTPIDLKPIYLDNSLLLVPLLSGSGTRGKILEALMYSRAVLTTSIGIEGLHLQPGEGVLIADGVESYKKAVIDWVKEDSSSHQNLVNKGREAVLNRYTWKKVGEDLIKGWSELLR